MHQNRNCKWHFTIEIIYNADIIKPNSILMKLGIRITTNDAKVEIKVLSKGPKESSMKMINRINIKCNV